MKKILAFINIIFFSVPIFCNDRVKKKYLRPSDYTVSNPRISKKDKEKIRNQLSKGKILFQLVWKLERDGTFWQKFKHYLLKPIFSIIIYLIYTSLFISAVLLGIPLAIRIYRNLYPLSKPFHIESKVTGIPYLGKVVEIKILFNSPEENRFSLIFQENDNFRLKEPRISNLLKGKENITFCYVPKKNIPHPVITIKDKKAYKGFKVLNIVYLEAVDFSEEVKINFPNVKNPSWKLSDGVLNLQKKIVTFKVEADDDLLTYEGKKWIKDRDYKWKIKKKNINGDASVKRNKNLFFIDISQLLTFGKNPSLEFNISYEGEDIKVASLSLEAWEDKCRSEIIHLMKPDLLTKKIDKSIKDDDAQTFAELVEGALKNAAYMKEESQAEWLYKICKEGAIQCFKHLQNKIDINNPYYGELPLVICAMRMKNKHQLTSQRFTNVGRIFEILLNDNRITEEQKIEGYKTTLQYYDKGLLSIFKKKPKRSLKKLSKNLLYYASKVGNLEELRYLQAEGVAVNIKAMNIAAESGHSEVVKWIHQLGVEPDQSTINAAAKGGVQNAPKPLEGWPFEVKMIYPKREVYADWPMEIKMLFNGPEEDRFSLEIQKNKNFRFKQPRANNNLKGKENITFYYVPKKNTAHPIITIRDKKARKEFSNTSLSLLGKQNFSKQIKLDLLPTTIPSWHLSKGVLDLPNKKATFKVEFDDNLLTYEGEKWIKEREYKCKIEKKGISGDVSIKRDKNLFLIDISQLLTFGKNPSLEFSISYEGEDIKVASLSLEAWEDKCRSEIVHLMKPDLLTEKIDKSIKDDNAQTFAELVENALKNTAYMKEERQAEWLHKICKEGAIQCFKYLKTKKINLNKPWNKKIPLVTCAMRNTYKKELNNDGYGNISQIFNLLINDKRVNISAIDQSKMSVYMHVLYYNDIELLNILKGVDNRGMKNLSLKDVNGDTAVHHASRIGNLEELKYLQTKDVVVDLKAMNIAAENGYAEIVKWIHQLGIDPDQSTINAAEKGGLQSIPKPLERWPFEVKMIYPKREVYANWPMEIKMLFNSSEEDRFSFSFQENDNFRIKETRANNNLKGKENITFYYVPEKDAPHPIITIRDKKARKEFLNTPLALLGKQDFSKQIVLDLLPTTVPSWHLSGGVLDLSNKKVTFEIKSADECITSEGKKWIEEKREYKSNVNKKNIDGSISLNRNKNMLIINISQLLTFGKNPSLDLKVYAEGEKPKVSSISLKSWENKCRSEMIHLMKPDLLTKKIDKSIKDDDARTFAKLVKEAPKNDAYMRKDRQAEWLHKICKEGAIQCLKYLQNKIDINNHYRGKLPLVTCAMRMKNKHQLTNQRFTNVFQIFEILLNDNRMSEEQKIKGYKTVLQYYDEGLLSIFQKNNKRSLKKLSKDLLYVAVKVGKLNEVKYLVGQGVSVDAFAVTKAAESGYTEIVTFFYKNNHINVTVCPLENVYDVAAKNGHASLIKNIYDEFCHNHNNFISRPSIKTMRIALENKQGKVVDMLQKKFNLLTKKLEEIKGSSPQILGNYVTTKKGVWQLNPFKQLEYIAQNVPQTFSNYCVGNNVVFNVITRKKLGEIKGNSHEILGNYIITDQGIWQLEPFQKLEYIDRNLSQESNNYFVTYQSVYQRKPYQELGTIEGYYPQRLDNYVATEKGVWQIKPFKKLGIIEGYNPQISGNYIATEKGVWKLKPFQKVEYIQGNYFKVSGNYVATDQGVWFIKNF